MENDGFCTKNGGFHVAKDGFTTENDAFRAKNDGFHTDDDGFRAETDGFILKRRTFAGAPRTASKRLRR